MSTNHPLRIGLLGCGVVGSPVARAIIEDPRYELAAVAVRDPGKKRSVSLDPSLLTTDPLAIANDPAIDVVIELIGGLEPAFSAISTAIRSSKPVVTANKELLARRGDELFAEARGSGQELRFEASIGGAIPIVRVITESLAGDRVRSIRAILNGTCNFVLTEMTKVGCTLEAALEKAQALGYAEVDPSADIEGRDAAAKIAILARFAFGTKASLTDVRCTGIQHVSQSDITGAEERGAVIKLIAGATHTARGVHLRVGPQLVYGSDLLSNVHGATNAVVVETERAGQLSFLGQGAGGAPTASSVLGDLATIASAIGARRLSNREPHLERSVSIRPNPLAICREVTLHEHTAAS